MGWDLMGWMGWDQMGLNRIQQDLWIESNETHMIKWDHNGFNGMDEWDQVRSNRIQWDGWIGSNDPLRPHGMKMDGIDLAIGDEMLWMDWMERDGFG